MPPETRNRRRRNAELPRLLRWLPLCGRSAEGYRLQSASPLSLRSRTTLRGARTHFPAARTHFPTARTHGAWRPICVRRSRGGRMEVCGPGGLRAPSRTSLSLSGSASRCPHAMVALWKGAMVGVQGAVMGVHGAVMVALWKADHPPDMMATLSGLQQREPARGTLYSAPTTAPWTPTTAPWAPTTARGTLFSGRHRHHRRHHRRRSPLHRRRRRYQRC